MVRCIVACCRNTNFNVQTATERISFFNLPKSEAMREIWFKAIGNVIMPRNIATAKICSVHFAASLHGEPNFATRQSDQRKCKHLLRNAVPTLNLGSPNIEVPVRRVSDTSRRRPHFNPPKLKVIFKQFELPVGGKHPIKDKINENTKPNGEEPKNKMYSISRHKKTVTLANSIVTIPQIKMDVPISESVPSSSLHHDLGILKSRESSSAPDQDVEMATVLVTKNYTSKQPTETLIPDKEPLTELDQDYLVAPVTLNDDLVMIDPAETTEFEISPLLQICEDVRITPDLPDNDAGNVPAKTSVSETTTRLFVKNNNPRFDRARRLSKRWPVNDTRSKPKSKTKSRLLPVKSRTPCSKTQPRSCNSESRDSVIGAFAEDVIDSEEDPMSYNYYNTIIALKAEIQFHKATVSAYKNTNAEIKEDCDRAEARCTSLTLDLVSKEVENKARIRENEKLKNQNEQLNARLKYMKKETIKSKQQRQDTVRSELEPRFTKDQTQHIIKKRKKLESPNNYFYIQI